MIIIMIFLLKKDIKETIEGFENIINKTSTTKLLF